MRDFILFFALFYTKKYVLPTFRCYSLMLVDTLKLVDSWAKSIFPLFYCMFCMILSGFLLFFCLFCPVSDGKCCFHVRKSILTSKRRAEHPFAGRNTQQLEKLVTLNIETKSNVLESWSAIKGFNRTLSKIGRKKSC